MKKETSARSITFILVAVHCITGNAVGIWCDNAIAEIIFFPFSYIAGLSEYAGWGSFSLILELVAIAIMLTVFYPLSLLVKLLLDRRLRKTTS